jgi:hypothetical protein
MKGLIRTNHTTYVAQKQCSGCPYVMRRVDKRRRFCSACLAKRGAVRNQQPTFRAHRRMMQEELETERLAQVLDEMFAIRKFAEGQ